MAAISQASRRRLVTSLLAQALISLVHLKAASADVITTEACARVRPEVLVACKRCPSVVLTTCCADTGVFQQCLRSVTNSTSDKHGVLAEDDINKIARPKRSEELESQLEEDLLAHHQQQFNADDLKRARPFLGKRSGEVGDDDEQDDEKRARPFLGKRTSQANEEGFSSEDLGLLEKRARPFLGKREQQELLRYGTYKRPRPFLGKRIIDGQETLEMEQDKRSRARPFLGKRSVDERATISRVKRARPFLGKRGGVSNEWVAEHLFKLHPELISLQSSEDKRARPFLG